MYLAIIIIPLIGSIVSGFFGRKIGGTGSQAITCTAVVLTTFSAVWSFFEVGFNNAPVYIEAFKWIDSGSLQVGWAFTYDSLTISMLIPVLVVSSLVHIYSVGYMREDPHIQRFFSYLSLFTFMMIILVTANNFLLMFVGWEGVGVCSYLLVCFWYTRTAANQSALSAFLINRVGDCFLMISMLSILWTTGNLDYASVFSLAPHMNKDVINIISICILIGAMAKSSQIGLHVWLPMAMEGPTPVSALIHAATMVTAGVYILIRSSPVIEYSSTVLVICLWLGAITTVFSSLIGLFQQDIKKVIAYSTMSQLGMMVIAVGLSSYNLALFHLVNHAFYKALLFLGAGSVIHAVADNQDFRRYGGLISFLPLTYSVMVVASLSLVAFPFMTGFYSKDLILESNYGQYYFSSTVVYAIATVGAMFTSLYSVKVLYLTFLTNPNSPIINYKKAHEGDVFMNLPLIILAVFSIFFGFLTKDMYIGLGSGFFSDNALFIHPLREILLDTELGVPTQFKLLPLFFTIWLSVIIIVLSEYFSTRLIYFKLSRLGYNIFSFFNQRFFIELFYNKYVSGIVLKLGGQTTNHLDRGVVESLGAYGLEKGLLDISKNIAAFSTGIINTYALYFVGAVTLYLNCTLYMSNNTIILIIIISLSFVLDISNKYRDPIEGLNIKQSGFSVKHCFYNFSLKETRAKLTIQIFFSLALVFKLLYGLLILIIYMFIKQISGYCSVVLLFFRNYLALGKNNWAGVFEWTYHNPPKPHKFISLSLQSVTSLHRVVERINNLESDINTFESTVVKPIHFRFLYTPEDAFERYCKAEARINASNDKIEQDIASIRGVIFQRPAHERGNLLSHLARVSDRSVTVVTKNLEDLQENYQIRNELIKKGIAKDVDDDQSRLARENARNNSGGVNKNLSPIIPAIAARLSIVSFFNIVFYLFPIVMFLNLVYLEIDLSLYIPETIYFYFPIFKYEIAITGPLFFLACILKVRRYFRWINLFFKVKDYIFYKDHLIIVLIFALILFSVFFSILYPYPIEMYPLDLF